MLTNPSIWNDPDEILRRQRFKHWHKELHSVLILWEFTAKQNNIELTHYQNIQTDNQQNQFHNDSFTSEGAHLRSST